MGQTGLGIGGCAQGVMFGKRVSRLVKWAVASLVLLAVASWKFVFPLLH